MKLRIVPFLLPLLLLALCAPAALAEPVTMDKVIITARGTDSTQSQTPGGTGVVEKEDILLAPKASVADSLARIPGLTQTGQSPWGQDVSIRGLSGNSVVVLIDGMRLNTATEINARLGFMNPLDVERVEVLKGPASSLYGTGSTGGVINIITKKGDYTPKMDVNGELIAGWTSNPAGPDGYARAVLSGENYWAQFSAGLRDHDDYYGGDDKKMHDSQYDDLSLRLAGGIKLTDRLDWDFQFMNMDAHEVGIPGGSSTMPRTAPIKYPDTSNTLVSSNLTFEPDSDVFKEVLFNFYFMKNERNVQIDRPKPAIRMITPHAVHETLGGKLQTQMLFGDHTVIAGVDAWNWHMTSSRQIYTVAGPVLSNPPTPNTSQLSTGIFVEDDWKLNEEFRLNLGARLDRIEVSNKANVRHRAQTHEDFGWNVHAGLTWEPVENWSHTLLAASSYRAPDILERFKFISLGAVTAQGNPNLDPEKSLFLEYGLHYNTAPLSVGAAVYYNYIIDYIEEKALSATVLREQNIGEARIYGLELEADWRFATAWNLYGNVALANGRDLENKEALRTVAPVNGLMGIKYTHDTGFWARVETPWALRQSEVPNGIDRTDAWLVVNTAAGYGFDWKETHHEITATVNNLFDKKYDNYLANSRAMQLLEPGISGSLMYALTF